MRLINLIILTLLLVACQEKQATIDKDSMAYEEPLPKLPDGPFEGVLYYHVGYVDGHDFEIDDLDELKVRGTKTIYVRGADQFTVTKLSSKGDKPYFSKWWLNMEETINFYVHRECDTLYQSGFDMELYKKENWDATQPVLSDVIRFGKHCLFQEEVIRSRRYGTTTYSHYYQPTIGKVDTSRWKIGSTGIKAELFMLRGAFDCIRLAYLEDNIMVTCLYKVEPKQLPDSLFTLPSLPRKYDMIP